MLKHAKSGFKNFTPLKPSEICRHPEHNPPTYYIYQPGHYEYECPSCKKVTKFMIPKINYSL